MPNDVEDSSTKRVIRRVGVHLSASEIDVLTTNGAGDKVEHLVNRWGESFGLHGLALMHF